MIASKSSEPDELRQAGTDLPGARLARTLAGPVAEVGKPDGSASDRKRQRGADDVGIGADDLVTDGIRAVGKVWRQGRVEFPNVRGIDVARRRLDRRPRCADHLAILGPD